MSVGFEDAASVSAEFTLTEEDLVAFAVIAQVRSPLGRGRANPDLFGYLFMGSICVGLGVGLLGQVAQSVGMVSDARSFGAGALVALPCAVFVLMFSRRMLIRRTATRRYADGTFQHMFDQHCVTLRDVGIHFTRLSGVDCFYPWSSVIHVMKTSGALYLFLTSASAVIVPQRAFTATEFDTFAARAERLWQVGKS